MKAPRESQEFWWNLVVAFQKSGLSRSRFCEQNNIKVTSFDYWRNRFKSSANPVVRSEIPHPWVTLQVADQQIVPAGAGIRMCIGRVTIEVESGFDPKLLADVLRVAGSAC